MYNNLMFGMKRRLLLEVENAFLNHPAFSEKVKVYNKFPYTERIQYGVILRNTAGSQIRLSPDNYMADSKSHVRLARNANYPGLSIEWVRENSIGVTAYIEEDVSAQLGPNQRQFFTSKEILSGPGNTEYANNPGQVSVTINGNEVMPTYVDGTKKLVLLARSDDGTGAFLHPNTGDVVKIGYNYRTIAEPGIYVVEFTEKDQFTVGAIYIIENELIFEDITGTETEADLDHGGIDPDTDKLYMVSKNGGAHIALVQGVDYTIDLATGHIIFLTTLSKHYNLYADYHYQPGYGMGPYMVKSYQEVHDAIPGVVIAVGRKAAKGDRQYIIVSKFREIQAKIYGGHWNMSLDLAVIAKDPAQMEEMTDQIVNYLWAQKKNLMEYEGITLNSVEPTGESEETFIDTTGDMYYESSVSVNVMTEWQRFIPYLYKIARILVRTHYWPRTGDFDISKDMVMIGEELEADTREVIKYPVVGYERIT